MKSTYLFLGAVAFIAWASFPVTFPALLPAANLVLLIGLGVMTLVFMFFLFKESGGLKWRK